MTTPSPHPRSPSLTVDVIIEIDDGIVLIERRDPPLGYALPGGFVEYDETVEAAAVREAFEETSLTVTLRALLGVYSDPARDSREHTTSVVFVAEGHGTLLAGDDAKHAMVVDINALPRDLCFDHAQILADYMAWRRDGKLPAPRLPLSPADRRAIADLAWQTLAATVASPISSVRPAFHGGPLSEPGSCFVSLRNKQGQVRGSMGSVGPSRTLALAVEEMTAAAATSNPQSPIRRSELADMQVEISVLAFTTEVIVASDDRSAPSR